MAAGPVMRCIEALLTQENVATILSLVGDHEFVDGRATAGDLARGVKHNLQLEHTDDTRAVLDRIVCKALFANDAVQRFALARRISIPLISCYQPGMEYGAHTDDAFIGAKHLRADVSATVFLSEPSSYTGGELIVTTSYGDIAVKLAAGDAVVYPTSAVHRVAPVTSGRRIAAVTWMQSHVRDPARREILADVHAVRSHLRDVEDANAEHVVLAGKVYSNLLRQWSEA